MFGFKRCFDPDPGRQIGLQDLEKKLMFRRAVSAL
jgi:hypothetical protein